MIPTIAEIRAVLLDRMTNGNEAPSALSLARAIHALLIEHAHENGGACAEADCPTPAVPGLDRCAEHVAQQIATLRRDLVAAGGIE